MYPQHQKNSMIFTTKNNELAIFGKTLDDVKNKYTNFVTALNTNGLIILL